MNITFQGYPVFPKKNKLCFPVQEVLLPQDQEHGIVIDQHRVLNEKTGNSGHKPTESKAEPEDRNKEKFIQNLQLYAKLVSEDEDSEEQSENEEENSDNEEDELFGVDVNDMENISSPKGSNQQRFMKVKMIDSTNASRHLNIEGYFQVPLLQPWWQFKIQIRKKNSGQSTQYSKYRVVAPPEVFVNEHVNSVVNLFLIRCGAEAQHIFYLTEFLNMRKLKLTFKNLEAMLNLIDKEEDFFGTGESILKCIRNSDQGKLLHCPMFLRYCSALFPSNLGIFLYSTSTDELERIDLTVSSDPWLLGYRTLMHRNFNLSCEVKLKGFFDSGLIYKIDSHMQDCLYVYNAMSKMTYQEGHTYIPIRKLKQLKYYGGKYVPLPRAISKKNFVNALGFLCQHKILEFERLKDGTDIVMFPHLKGYEVTISTCLTGLMRGRPCVPEDAVNAQDFGDDQDQLEAAKKMTRLPVLILSGKGGCGKTHVVSKVLSNCLEVQPEDYTEKTYRETGEDNSAVFQELGKEYCKRSGLYTSEVLLTAPTGKAASILRKRTNIKAYTMHQVIFSYVGHRRTMKQPMPPESQEWHFKETKILICDECSLVAVRLFAFLVSILMREAKLVQVVLLGDINQLPSIEPGNFFVDIFIALSKYSASVKLKINHRSEAELIVRNADRISHQIMPMFNVARGFVNMTLQDESHLSECITSLLKSHSNSASMIKIGKVGGDRNSQFIAFRRKDCELINDLCCHHYNKHRIKNDKWQRIFRVGDKICATKNKEVVDEVTKESFRITNGEIFFLLQDIEVVVEEENGRKKKRYWVLDDLDKEIKIDYHYVVALKMKHAYARTIHTFQGSESETLVYVVGSPYYQTWQHVYTAVTRGKRQDIIVYKKESLQQAVSTPARKRYTRLSEFLIEALEKAGYKQGNEPVDLSLLDSQKWFSTQPKNENKDDEVFLTCKTKLDSQPSLNAKLQATNSKSFERPCDNIYLTCQTEQDAPSLCFHPGCGLEPHDSVRPFGSFSSMRVKPKSHLDNIAGDVQGLNMSLEDSCDEILSQIDETLFTLKKNNGTGRKVRTKPVNDPFLDHSSSSDELFCTMIEPECSTRQAEEHKVNKHNDSDNWLTDSSDEFFATAVPANICTQSNNRVDLTSIITDCVSEDECPAKYRSEPPKPSGNYDPIDELLGSTSHSRPSPEQHEDKVPSSTLSDAIISNPLDELLNSMNYFRRSNQLANADSDKLEQLDIFSTAYTQIQPHQTAKSTTGKSTSYLTCNSSVSSSHDCMDSSDDEIFLTCTGTPHLPARLKKSTLIQKSSVSEIVNTDSNNLSNSDFLSAIDESLLRNTSPGRSSTDKSSGSSDISAIQSTPPNPNDKEVLSSNISPVPFSLAALSFSTPMGCERLCNNIESRTVSHNEERNAKRFKLTIKAKFGGTCHVCHRRISQNEEITAVYNGGRKLWVHLGCDGL